MALSTNHIQIYIPLLNEGTEVFRPTTGVVVSQDIVQVEPTADYDPDAEEWEFPPGSKVYCTREFRNGNELLIARRQVG
jgi:hypothetical protein